MKRKLFLIPAAIAGVSLIACGGGGKKPTPVVKEYDVSLKMTEAMSIDKQTVLSNEDFDAYISVKSDFTDYCQVPEKLYEVHVNGIQLEGDQYTYTRDSDNQAHLYIPSENVTGDIEIFAEAKADTISVALAEGHTEKLSIDRDSAIIGGSFRTKILLNDSFQDKWSVPEKLLYGSVTCIDAQDHKKYNLTPCCKYEKFDDNSAMLTIPAKRDGVVVITGEITIDLAPYKPTYSYEIIKQENITIEAASTTPPVKGEDFTFNVTTSGDYKIPSAFDISVDDVPTYNYEVTGAGTQSGTVKINGKSVSGDIAISGSGKKNAAPVKYYLGGIEDLTKEEAVVGQDFTCELVAMEGHDAPQADDIRVRVGDDKDADSWLIPNENDGVAFDESTSTLTISSNLIDATKTVHIAARANDVKLLEFYSSQGDWASVETAANLGYAEYLFEIGEESVPFTLNDGSNDSYRIRILGFEKDKNYLYENKAGITFEFTTGVSQQYFGKSTSSGTYSTYFYKKGSDVGYQSDLYDYLNTTLYNSLPFKKYINNVRKYTVSGSYATIDSEKEKIMESGNYLFPLSLKEMKLESTISGEFDQEGPSGTNEAYPYYEKGGSIVKTDGTNPVTYWLRSPANIKNPQIYTINSDLGKRASAPARGQKLYVAPAFCF